MRLDNLPAFLVSEDIFQQIRREFSEPKFDVGAYIARLGWISVYTHPQVPPDVAVEGPESLVAAAHARLVAGEAWDDVLGPI